MFLRLSFPFLRLVLSMASDWSRFEILADQDPESITWASRGGDGSGKSYFACTAPGPIFWAAFDTHGLLRVDKGIRREREIRIQRYGYNHLKQIDDRNRVKQLARPIWDRFMDDFEQALKKARSIILDREDMAYELIRYAFLGGEKNEGSKTGALDYGDINKEFASMLQAAKDAKVNLGLLQGWTDKWESKFDPSSGKLKNYNTGVKPDGWKKVADYADITIDHRWDEKKKAYIATTRKFPAKDEKDKDFENFDFLTMAITAFPDSDPTLWMQS